MWVIIAWFDYALIRFLLGLVAPERLTEGDQIAMSALAAGVFVMVVVAWMYELDRRPRR